MMMPFGPQSGLSPRMMNQLNMMAAAAASGGPHLGGPRGSLGNRLRFPGSYFMWSLQIEQYWENYAAPSLITAALTSRLSSTDIIFQIKIFWCFFPAFNWLTIFLPINLYSYQTILLKCKYTHNCCGIFQIMELRSEQSPNMSLSNLLANSLRSS